jgi:hypothetical protein
MRHFTLAVLSAFCLLVPAVSQATPRAQYMMSARQVQQATQAARGYAPGTLGHELAVRRAGFYHDSVGLEIAAGARRGTRQYNLYWSHR